MTHSASTVEGDHVRDGGAIPDAKAIRGRIIHFGDMSMDGLKRSGPSWKVLISGH